MSEVKRRVALLPSSFVALFVDLTTYGEDFSCRTTPLPTRHFPIVYCHGDQHCDSLTLHRIRTFTHLVNMAYTPHARSPSPSRRSGGTPLPDIPEASPAPVRPKPARPVTPGPNSWAIQAEKFDKHRLQSNAFYQQEMAKRKLTPPTAIHPAFRANFCLESSVAHTGPTRIRDSGLTTMSPFMQAIGLTPPTPPMLVPTDCFQALPTDRGFIEEHREQIQHRNSGIESDRTPVFVYTPKVSSSEFSKSTIHATPKKKKVGVLDWVASSEQTKSPRKGLLGKLGFTTPGVSQPTASSTSQADSRGYNVGGETLPPKAKAVLSSSPLKANLGRTPSKKHKGLFSWKTSDQPYVDVHKVAPASAPTEPRSAGALTVNFSDSTGKTPQTTHTAFSDPTYDRHGPSKRAVSQTHSEKGGFKQQVKDKGKNACGVSRTQSLQYIDRTKPPTPPAKNTPPHEKAFRAQQEAKARLIMNHHQMTSEQRSANIIKSMTPKKEMSQTPVSKLTSPLHNDIFEDDTPTHGTARLVGADGRTSPTRYGTYARKEVPTIVKRPSVYSISASLYPDLQDECSFEEMKKVTDGLGLEGLSELPENFYNRSPKITYSASDYADEIGPRPSSIIQTSPSMMLHQTGMFKESPSLPAVWQRHRPTPSRTPLQEKKSGSSHGTIPLVYPDLASDPSRTYLGKALRTHHRSNSDIQFPVHSRTHSSNKNGSPPRKPTDVDFSLLDEDVPLSPPSYSCPSAMPSPLQILPPSAYTSTRKANVEASPTSPCSIKTLTPSRSRGRIETFKNTDTDSFKSTSSPTARGLNSPFDNFPTLSPSIKPSVDDSPPAAAIPEEQPEPMKHARGSPIDVPPSAAVPTLHPEPTKHDRGSSPISNTTDGNDGQQAQQATVGETQLQIMIRRMQTQQGEIAQLRAELLAIGKRHVPHDDPPTRATSSASGSFVGHVTSIGNDNDSDVNFTNSTPGPTSQYIPDAGLAQMGLYHRVHQQRVDPEYDEADVADMERYQHSNEVRKQPKKDNGLEEIIDVLGILTRKVKELDGASKKE
jgi:hypothetical protein